MDYTQLTVDDEITVIRGKIRDAEAQHFAHTTDLHTLASLGVDQDKVALIEQAVETLEAQVAFLNTHLQALITFKEQNTPAEPEAD